MANETGMPFANLMGVEIVERSKARVSGRLVVREDLCTAGGILHGGAFMAFADALGAVGGFLNLPVGARTTTLESKTNFLGSWIGMQLLMRRPEIEGFMSIAAMANRYDFSFLAPCPSSGLFVHGSEDRVAPVKEVMAVIEKVKTQKGIQIEHAVVEGANHFFDGRVDQLMEAVSLYLDRKVGPEISKAEQEQV